MAVKNRNETIIQVDAKIVPTVTNIVHKDLLNNDIVNSVVFRKDVKKSYSAGAIPPGGAIDFSDCDFIAIVVTHTTSINPVGLADGDVKYLHVIKPTHEDIIFVHDLSESPYALAESSNEVLYSIFSKNNVIYAKALTPSVKEADIVDFNNNSSYKFVTPKIFNTRTEVAITKITLSVGFKAGSYAMITRTYAGWDSINNKELYAYDIGIYLWLNGSIGIVNLDFQGVNLNANAPWRTWDVRQYGHGANYRELTVNAEATNNGDDFSIQMYRAGGSNLQDNDKLYYYRRFYESELHM
ncbi:MAG: hypothetical protein DRI95_00610 [Bacteroidetes bacterium]|nr:MAG: hypothetical protein DRI95_00610 [Bacteroidota bacterium]